MRIDEFVMDIHKLVRTLDFAVDRGDSTGKDFALALNTLVANDEETEQRRATAFQVLAVHLRHLNKYNDWSQLLRLGSQAIPGNQLVSFQHAVHYKTVNPSETRLKLAIDRWAEVDEQLLDSPAFGQAYADTIAMLYFRGSGKLPDDHRQKRQLQHALSVANLAALKRPSAKSLNTHAKLLALHGEFERATAIVYEAIGLEDRQRPDYDTRILEFQLTGTRIETIKSFSEQVTEIEASKEEMLAHFAHELQEKSTELNQKLDRSRVDLLTFMSLFAGVLALLITGGSLAQSTDFATSAGTLVILGAVLIVVFSVFLLLIDFSKQRVYVTAASLGISGGLAIAALFIYAGI